VKSHGNDCDQNGVTEISTEHDGCLNVLDDIREGTLYRKFTQRRQIATTQFKICRIDETGSIGLVFNGWLRSERETGIDK